METLQTFACARCAAAFEATASMNPTGRLMCATCTTIVYNPRSAIEEARGNLSRAEAARRTGIPLRTLENWESGKRKPPPYIVESVIEKLTQARQ